MLGKYKDNEIVKSLLDAGLEEEYILDGIEKGEIKVEKSKEAKEDEKEKTEPEAEKEKIEEEEDDLEEMEKSLEVKKAELTELEEKFEAAKAKKGGKKKDDKKEGKKEEGDLFGKIEKSEDSKIGGEFDSEAFEKSMADKIEKSMSDLIEDKLGELRDELELLKSENESLRADVNTIGNSGAEFKAPDNLSFIEKGMAEIKDSSGKQMLHVRKQREQVKDVLLKAYDEAEDESEIKKSIADELSAYSSDSEATSIDGKVAKHLYDKHSVRLLK